MSRICSKLVNVCSHDQPALVISFLETPDIAAAVAEAALVE